MQLLPIFELFSQISQTVVQVCEKAIYYCIKNDFQLLASEQTCFQHIDIANKLVLSFVRGAVRSSWNPH